MTLGDIQCQVPFHVADDPETGNTWFCSQKSWKPPSSLNPSFFFPFVNLEFGLVADLFRNAVLASQ